MAPPKSGSSPWRAVNRTRDAPAEPSSSWLADGSGRPGIHYTQCLRALAEEHFRQAEKNVLEQCNVNTHAAALICEAFEPVTALRRLERFEFHYTPKHGSWLSIAEIELSVLSRQCLARRISDWDTLRRNQPNCKINCRFTTEDARIKLNKNSTLHSTTDGVIDGRRESSSRGRSGATAVPAVRSITDALREDSRGQEV